jgi:AcrR family transcriptional regulator
MSPATTRPRRRRDALRRPQILKTAIGLVREKGLWSVRISDIAERAGMSAPNVVYYFGTKDDLLVEAIGGVDDAFYEDAREALEHLPRARERLVALIVRSSTADWLLWMELWVYARHHPDTAAAQRRFHRRWRRAMVEVIELGVANGEWRVADAADVAQRLCALTEGLAVHMVLGEPDHTPERYVELSLAAAALELGCEPAELRA